ncbi:MAG: ImmA/IrrE family metallo-endopeptidase [Candidatus Omnitrophota bacterium]|jgi:Zn-dependent peptidase ImmA (M78 family)|nr:MAG: ImmA/IrrE family metallo-endopeptidase [Candidatus Omnitrophota bacterium]
MIEKPRYSHASKIAQKALKEAQVNAPPVDVNKILNGLRINFLPYSFPDKVSAILLKDNNMLVIGVNKNHPPNRQRFSIAHEIGHYLLGHYKEIFVDTAEISEGRFEAADEEHNKVQEQEANYFAGELLMPSDMLKKDFLKLKNVEEIAKLYQVSKEALWIRLLKLKLV